jgi:hypothetical protein
MKEVLTITENELELIKITFKVLKKFCKFDELKIYETENHFVIHTINRKEKYFTKTTIGKIHWRVIDSVCSKIGEEEIKLN